MAPKAMLLLLAASFLAAPFSRAIDPSGAPPVGPLDPMTDALVTGANVAQTFLLDLKPYATTNFPGALAWVNGAGATFAGLDRNRPTDAWKSLDPDQLITKNPAWWQLFYEVTPGDPGLAMLQGGCLLCARDAQRALIVLRLSLNHKGLDAGSARVIVTVLQHAGAYMEPSHALVREGLVLHDSHKYLEAIAKYDAALRVWPRNGWALYEKGFSILAHEKKRELPQLTVDLYARTRAVDPFQWNAWQGSLNEMPGIQDMHEIVQPLWENSVKDLNFQMTDDDLTRLADALQLAEVDDLALIARQLLVHRRGNYAPSDQPFIAKSLRRLAPGERTEATLARLASPSFKVIRLYESLGMTRDGSPQPGQPAPPAPPAPK